MTFLPRSSSLHPAALSRERSSRYLFTDLQGRGEEEGTEEWGDGVNTLTEAT